MQLGVFSVSDITEDPTTGERPSYAQRIAAEIRIARHAEEVGLDVFAIGEHHNPPFFSSSPTTTLARIAAETTRLILSTSTTLITTDDPVKIAEDFAMLQHVAQGRVDLMMGRGNTGPVYPWFGKDIRQGIPLAIENYALLRELWEHEDVDWQGRFRTPLRGFTSVPRPLDGIPPFVWHGSIRSPEIAEQAAYYGDGFFHNNIFWPASHTKQMVDLYRSRFEHYGHGPAKTAIVGLGGQFFMRPRSQDAWREFRPFFDNAPVYGHGPTMEEFTELTPLTVGSPQQVIDRTLGFREVVGDYQRQLFLIDHAGLPFKTVLEQLDYLGEIAPVLRREFEAMRDPEVPSDPPTHDSLLAARYGEGHENEAVAAERWARDTAAQVGGEPVRVTGASLARPDPTSSSLAGSVRLTAHNRAVPPASPLENSKREGLRAVDFFGQRQDTGRADAVTGASFYPQQDTPQAAVEHADELLRGAGADADRSRGDSEEH